MNNFNNRTNMSILIVDDNSRMRDVIRDMITTQFGEKVKNIFECDSGEESIECYDRENPAWVIMDIKMGGIDGLKASQIILSSHPNAKIIIVTQYDDTEYYDLAKKIGLKAFVLKENLSDIPIIMKDVL